MASRSNPFPMGTLDPLPAGYVIWFGSLEFRATSNGYLMELLSPRRNPDTLTSPAQRNRRSDRHSRQARVDRHRAARLSSPAWVEAAMSQLSVAAGGATTSSSRASASSMPAPSSTAASVPPRGARLRRRPFSSGCTTLPLTLLCLALTLPSRRICWVITFCRSATSLHHLLTTPTPRRRA
jgi:hypothetical protein